MRSLLTGVLLLTLCASSGLALTYRVMNVNDSGSESLRSAITAANLFYGPDRIVFAWSLRGGVIRPTTPLPYVTGNATTIDGDIDNDGLPDIAIDGVLMADPGVGLLVWGDRCIFEGLAVVNFHVGLTLNPASDCIVRDCNLGLDLAGATAHPNITDIHIQFASGNTIGEAGRPNYFGCGNPTRGGAGIDIWNSTGNTIQHNVFGLDRTGTTAIGEDEPIGIDMVGDATDPATDNTIRNNVFAGLRYGLELDGACDNVIRGNTFGLATDGNTNIPIYDTGIQLWHESCNNLIGGANPAQRNAFAGGQKGIEFQSEGTCNNRLFGNYFGCNAAGTRQKPLLTGIEIGTHAGRQVIGGTTLASGNYFTPKKATGYPTSIYLDSDGAGTLIRNNRFGVLPDGRTATECSRHIDLYGSDTSCTIRDNRFHQAETAIYCGPSSTRDDLTGIYGNRFATCSRAVDIRGEARVILGNLGNPSTTDDGGNIFYPSCDYAIYNYRAANTRAEGNDFRTTVSSEIAARILDYHDNRTYGRVDFIPLIGGVNPTGGAEGSTAVLAAASALPTPAGAEIAFSLSAPAGISITIRNLAGRPVATVLRDRPLAAGLQRAVWSGLSDQGTRVPAGTYLVELSARAADGAESRALTTLRMTR